MSGKCQAGGTATDNEDIDFVRQAVCVGQGSGVGIRFMNNRITGLEAIEMKLHETVSSATFRLFGNRPSFLGEAGASMMGPRESCRCSSPDFLAALRVFRV